jgi:hypothetical protein
VTTLRTPQRGGGRLLASVSRIPRQSVIFTASAESPEDNLAMDQHRDLLPWIFGGLSMATLAIALTVGSTNRTAPRNSQAPSQTTAHTLPEATTAPAPAQTLAAAQIQTPASPALASPALASPALTSPTLASPTPAPQMLAPPIESNGQVWECTINGQRTFSDNPCGDKSSLHEIGPINRMDPTPILPHARSYAPESSYQPEYSYQGGQEDSAPGEQQFTDNSYPVFVGIPVREHRRPDHPHRPHGHSREPPPRKN